MIIRNAEAKDIENINILLKQVLDVHHEKRPDLFYPDAKKYTDRQLTDIINDDNTPVFVAVNDDGLLVGYAFCVFIRHLNNNILTDIKTLYIDDLCVDKEYKGNHIGTSLYNYVLDFAKKSGCYNVTLNVWACNETAIKFYEKCGLKPQKIGMETIL